MVKAQGDKKHVTGQFLKNIAKGQGKKVKEESCRLLQIRPDSQVLDVGCGPGVDTIRYAKLIGAAGRVVGVDSDPEMVAEANAEITKHKITKNIRHIVGDVQSLPFGDGEFDRVHAERLFQVLPRTVDSRTVFGEMQRVLKPGGIVVLADTDWATASVNFSDTELERKLLGFFSTQMRPNGFAGRQLLSLLKNGNFEHVELKVFPIVSRTLAETPFGNWLTTEATKAGVATKEEMALWRRELEEKTTRQMFLSQVNIIIVAGKKKN